MSTLVASVHAGANDPAHERGLDGLFYHTTHEGVRKLVAVLHNLFVFLVSIFAFPPIEPRLCQFGAKYIKRHDDCQDGHELERQKSKNPAKVICASSSLRIVFAAPTSLYATPRVCSPFALNSLKFSLIAERIFSNSTVPAGVLARVHTSKTFDSFLHKLSIRARD